MKVDVYLEGFNTDFIEDFSIDKCCMEPILFTDNSKNYFKEHYPSSYDEIVQAIHDKIPVIHVKNTDKKYYDVTTPYCGKVQPDAPKDLLQRMFALIGIIGTYPVLYKDENETILRAVAPRKDSYNEFSSQSPFTDLDWHVDAAYRPMFEKNELSPMPDYLVFGIVHNGQEQLPITYVALADLINELNEDDVAIGLSPEFTVLSPDSFKNRTISEDVSLLSKDHNGIFYNRIAFNNTIPQTERAKYFLQKIRSIVDQPHMQNLVNVKAGDVVILNNKTTLHKRDSYTPQWNGKDRYFIRIYSVKDLCQGMVESLDRQWEWV